jgi:type IV pilus assembly protein PilB
MTTHRYLGELLVRAGVVDAAGLDRVISLSANEPQSLGRAVAGAGLADEGAVAAAIATALRLEHFDGEAPRIDAAVTALLPAAFCAKNRVAPISADAKTIRVAITDPMDYSTLKDVEFRTARKAIPVVVTQSWLEEVLLRLFPVDAAAFNYDMLEALPPGGEVENTPDHEYELVDPATLAKDVRLPPIVKLVNLVLTDAAKAGASDVHIEPHESAMQVRQRVDGLLRDVLSIPQHLQAATISRLKIMSGMDIAERRKPQDGRSRLRYNGRRIDLRVSAMPTQFGEKIVIRLLGSDKPLWTLDQLDLSESNRRLLGSFLGSAQGMILVTGPTGSGKSSTLYSAVNTIKSKANNIITLEDPIEIQIPGVNQMQVNVRAGVTFASGLRSVLRQDPNVILVGEIRDRETAEIAIGAAQTGHLLLSTLHTNDAVATLTRLGDLGVEPFMLSASLLGVVAQRLVRRVCPSCAIPQPPSPGSLAKVGAVPADAQWMAGSGCDDCGQSGYKGRIAIHEVFAINDELRGLIASRAAEHVIKRAAVRAGMRTLLDDGIEKAARGSTTLDEVLRVVASGDSNEAAREVPVASAAISPLPPVAGGRVLVVEDSATIATVVKYFLELEGFDVSLAVDGSEGLKVARQDHPDVIVADVNMPGISGVDMVKALRDGGCRARILMLTSESTVDRETDAFAAGADDYLVKPVEPRRLAARVKALRQRTDHVAA